MTRSWDPELTLLLPESDVVLSKYNRSHECHLKFPSSHILKPKKKQVD